MVDFRRGRMAGLVTVAAGGALLLSACSGGTGGDSGDSGGAGGDAEPITLGASFEVTGPVAVLGEAWQKGAELGVDAANGTDGFEVDGKTYTWDLEVKDNQGTPDRTITDMQEFRSQNVDFLLGPGLSTSIGPVINSLGNYTPIIMTPTALGVNFLDEPAGENLFITHMPDTGDDGRIAGMADILVERFAPTKVAILGIQDDSDELYADLFSEYLGDAGVEIVYNESFPTETRDFSTYISAIAAQNPDMIIGPHLDTYMNPFLQQAVDVGLGDVVMVGRPGTTVNAAKDIDVANYVWPVSTRALDNADDPKVAGVREAWTEKYGSEPDPNSFWALSYYDAVLILTQAMQQAGTTTDLDAIREALLSDTEWQDTVLGQQFNENHQAVYAPQVGFLENGVISYEDAE